MNDYQPILNNIKRYVALNSEEEAAFTAIIEPKVLKRKEFLVQPGMVCRHQSYVYKGALRNYFVSPDGAEHTLQFAIEDWFVSDFPSYVNQQPATLHIEALEDAIVHQIAYDRVEALCKVHSKFEHFFRLVAQKAFVFAQRRILTNLGMTAEERFIEFNTMYPEIVRRVPQYALASYLGITPEFLSKIRKRMAGR